MKKRALLEAAADVQYAASAADVGVEAVASVHDAEAGAVDSAAAAAGGLRAEARERAKIETEREMVSASIGTKEAKEAKEEAKQEVKDADGAAAVVLVILDDVKDQKVARDPNAAGDRFPLGLARFCASIHVVVGHLFADNLTGNVYFFGWGFTWVPWFFMLSGFVLATSFLRKPKQETMFQFAMQRSVSIYPLYAFSLLLSFAIAWKLGQSPSWKVIISQVFLTQAWIPQLTEQALQTQCWFLSCMVVYWFLFKPLSHLLKMLSFRGVVITMMALFALPWLVVIIPKCMNMDDFWYLQHQYSQTATRLDIAVVMLKFSPICYLHVFCIGMLLAKLRLQLDTMAVAAGKTKNWCRPLELLVPLGYGGLALIFSVPSLQPWGSKLTCRVSVLLPLQAMILLGLAGLPSLPLPRLAKWASRLNGLERFSYGIYVFQFIALDVWPTWSADFNVPLFIFFLLVLVMIIERTIQKWLQDWWSRHTRGRLAVPFLLAAVLAPWSLVSPPKAGATAFVPLPAFVRLDARMLDTRLPVTDSQGMGAAIINPSLAFQDGYLSVAARRHSQSTNQYIGSYQGQSVTVLEYVWNSDILLGKTAVDLHAMSSWPTTGIAPFQLDLSAWTGLQTEMKTPWTQLCAAETYLAFNNTLLRYVVTGPEDPKLLPVNGSMTLVFDSNPPQVYGNCSAARKLTQMYMATGVDASKPGRASEGTHLKYGQSDVVENRLEATASIAEKNWIPFEYGNSTFFAYSPSPHVIISTTDDGTVSDVASTSYLPFNLVMSGHSELNIRGSGQAAYIDDASATPNLPRAHYLALLHIYDATAGSYAHFAYRFSPHPPFSVLQVSQQLPLMTTVSPQRPNAAAFAFASGLLVVNRTVAISYGAGDADARALVMTLDRLDEFFLCSPEAAASNSSNSSGSSS